MNFLLFAIVSVAAAWLLTIGGLWWSHR